jgi:DNA-binding transcriptional regulator YiaG
MDDLLAQLRSYGHPKPPGESLSSERVAAIRDGLGLNKAQFARALCVSLTTVYRWESATNERPIHPVHLKRLLEIEAALKAEANGHG